MRSPCLATGEIIGTFLSSRSRAAIHFTECRAAGFCFSDYDGESVSSWHGTTAEARVHAMRAQWGRSSSRARAKTRTRRRKRLRSNTPSETLEKIVLCIVNSDRCYQLFIGIRKALNETYLINSVRQIRQLRFWKNALKPLQMSTDVHRIIYKERFVSIAQ